MERGIDNESVDSVAGALHQKKSIRIEDLSTANDLDSSSNIDSQIGQSCAFIGNGKRWANSSRKDRQWSAAFST
jgi:hypothetical protein